MHLFAFSGLRDPSTDRAETVSGCPCTPLFLLTQPVHLLTIVQNMMHTNPVCSQYMYLSGKVQNTFIGPVQLLIDTSSGPHGMTLWLQLSHNIDTPDIIYIYNLNTAVSSKLYGIHWFAYYSTHY